MRRLGISILEPAGLDDWNFVVTVVVVKCVCLVKVIDGGPLFQLVHRNAWREVLRDYEDDWHSDVFSLLVIVFEKGAEHEISAIFEFSDVKSAVVVSLDFVGKVELESVCHPLNRLLSGLEECKVRLVMIVQVDQCDDKLVCSVVNGRPDSLLAYFGKDSRLQIEFKQLFELGRDHSLC